MIHGDCTKLRTKDWSDADVIFINSTCFDENTMSKIAIMAGECMSLFESIAFSIYSVSISSIIHLQSQYNSSSNFKRYFFSAEENLFLFPSEINRTFQIADL